MQISIQVQGLDQLRSQLGGMARQLPFATARALTQTAVKVRQATPALIDSQIDRPTRFTRASSGMFVSPATRTSLTATVGFKGRQASYLRWQIDGGRRTNTGIEGLLQSIGAMPKSGYVAVPGSGAKLDAFGNIRKSIWPEIIGSLRTKLGTYRKRGKAVSRVGYFAVLPGVKSNLAPGVWLRVTDRGSAVKPILLFVTGADYRKRLQWYPLANRVVADEFPKLFDASLATALATAR